LIEVIFQFIRRFQDLGEVLRSFKDLGRFGKDQKMIKMEFHEEQ